MAGIGFELYRILHKGTLGSILKVFFLGAMIVAGPWILSVLSIYVIQKYAVSAIAEHPALFTVTIVYIYAFSLFLYGGVHYVFSRYIADMLYIEDRDSIPSALVTIFIVIIVTSALISYIFLIFNDFEIIEFHALYKVSFILLFAAVNLIWIMLVYVALLKEYNKIFFSYLAGIASSIGGVFYYGKLYGVAGALLGYALGQFVIVILLLAISHRSYPLKLLCFNKDMLKYFRDFKYLMAIGMFFNMAIWIDKIIYWLTYGINIKGTIYYYFIEYDIPVFLGFLTMIPGLVYFLVVTESIFHREYTKFIKNILQDTLRDIKSNKDAMIGSLKKGFSQLILFQGVWTFGLIFNTKKFLQFMGYGSIDPGIMITIFIAVFFHMLALTMQIYLLYLELRKEAVISTILYFASNAFLTLLFIYWGLKMPGLSFFMSAVICSLYTAFCLYRKAAIIDYIIFNRT